MKTTSDELLGQDGQKSRDLGSAMTAFFNRYPWLFGYLVSPVLFAICSECFPDFSTPAFSPLLMYSTSFSPFEPWFKSVLISMWYFHFLRRAAEVAWVNQYTGVNVPEPRNSAVEFIYYAVWGVLNGLCSAQAMLRRSGMPPLVLVYLGLSLFWVGQAGNWYCHVALRQLRPSGSTHYVIPRAFPFSIIVAPHYSFELLTWLGFTIASGLTFPSLLILLLSLVILVPMALNRKNKYLKLSEGDDEADVIKRRWAIIPGVV